MSAAKPRVVSGNRSIVRNAGYLLAGTIGARTLRVVYFVVLARVFGPELFGLFTHAQFWHVIFMSLAIFGTGRLLSRKIGGDRGNAEAYVATNISLRLLTSLVATLGCALVALAPGLDPQARELLLLFALAVLGRSLATWEQQVFIAFEVAQLGLRLGLLFRTLDTVLGLVAVAMGADLLLVAAIHALSWFLQAIVGWQIVQRELVPIRFDWHWSELKRLAGTGVAFMLSSLFASALFQGGLLLYKLLVDQPIELGQLAVAMQILALTAMVPKSIAAAALPVLSRWVAEGEGGERRSMTLMLRSAIVGTACVALVGGALAPPLILWVIGEEYRTATELIRPVLWLLLPLGLGTLLTEFLIAHDHFWSAAAGSGAGALSMIPVIALTVTDFGLSGVLLGTAVGATIWATSAAWLAVRRGWLAGIDGVRRSAAAALLATASFWLVADVSSSLALVICCSVLILGLAPPRVLVRHLRRRRP